MNESGRKKLQLMAKDLRAKADMLDEISGAVDIAKVIFDKGRQVLAPHMPKGQQGSFIGKLRKAVGDDNKVLEAIREAPYQADPVSWLAAIFNGRMGWQEYAKLHELPARPGESYPEWQRRVEAIMANENVARIA